MKTGIVSNWSEHAPHPPFVTLGLSLLLVFFYLVYAGRSPLMQQAMIDVGGMHPARIAALLHQDMSTWWGLSSMGVVSALFLHASWSHLLGNLVYLWVFGIKVERGLGSLGLLAVFLLV